MKKTVWSLFLVVVLIGSLCVPAFAATKNTSGHDVHVMLTNTDYAEAALAFDGDCASCGALVLGKTGTNKITAIVYLKRVYSDGTETVKAWTGLSVSGKELDFDRSYYVSSGYTYRLVIDAHVYRNGTSEYIEVSSPDQYCG